MKVPKEKNFWAITLILTVAVILIAVAILDLFDFGFLIGRFRLNHWLAWIGTLYVPLQYLQSPS